MARGQEKSIVGGGIDPFVQQSMQQNKQLAESRLLTAMKEKGATERAGMQEAGATQRTGMQIGAQRDIEASRTASADRRTAEDERSRREDQKYKTTMAQASQDFQAMQAELGRDFQRARDEENWDRIDALEKKRDAYRIVDSRERLEASKDNINAIVSMGKGLGGLETYREKINTMAEEQTKEYEEGNELYNTKKEAVRKAIEYDNRMDAPIKKSPWGIYKRELKPKSYWDYVNTGKLLYRAGKAIKEEYFGGDVYDPMGVLQDQITKHDGKISLENLSSANIHKVAEGIQAGEVKKEDILATLGVLESVSEMVGEQRKGLDRRGDMFKAKQSTYLDMIQFIDSLEGLVNKTNLKVKGSETQTVGSIMEDALGMIKGRSLGAQTAFVKKEMVGKVQEYLGPLTEARQIPSIWELTPDMSPETRKLVMQRNANTRSVWSEFFSEEDGFMGPQLEGAGASASDFNPEGSNYDYNTARAAGGKPDATSGHWSSLDPRTGMVLKGRNHPTWDLMMEEEERLGNKVIKRNGRYYSVKK